MSIFNEADFSGALEGLGSFGFALKSTQSFCANCMDAIIIKYAFSSAQQMVRLCHLFRFLKGTYCKSYQM